MAEFWLEHSIFSRFMGENDLHNWEESSDGGSASNSDAEPEVEDSEAEDIEDNTKTRQNTVTRGQAVSDRNWRYIAPCNSNKVIPNFTPEGALTNKSNKVECIKDCFHLFIDSEIIESIVFCTNKKAEESMPSSNTWKPIDKVEIDAFFGLLLLIGRNRESRESKKDLWRINEAHSRPIYRAVMSRDRFTHILKYLRFDCSVTCKERKVQDKLAPLRDVTKTFVRNCKEAYSATSVGCIGEQLVSFRGCCSFKVHIPYKPGKYGIKIWTLCDSKTFYCCNMEIYLGKQGNQRKKQQGQNVAKELASIWKYSNRCITTDSNLTDITLAEELLKDKIFLVGTVQCNKRDLPEALINIENRTQYSSEFLFTDDVTLVSYIPKPRKSIVLLSTLHHNHEISTAEEKFKPAIMKYYNSTKSGVDVLSKLLREYTCRRATRRWPLSLFMHYLDIAAYNAFIIWQLKHPEWESKLSLQSKRKQFLEQLGEELVAKNIDRRAAKVEQGEGGLQKYVIKAIEATGRQIAKIECVPDHKRSRCRLCVGNNNKYSNRCNICRRHVCKNHSTQMTEIKCTVCNRNVE